MPSFPVNIKDSVVSTEKRIPYTERNAIKMTAEVSIILITE